MKLDEAIAVAELQASVGYKVAITNPYLRYDRDGIFLTVQGKFSTLLMNYPVKSSFVDPNRSSLSAVVSRSIAYCPIANDLLREDWEIYNLLTDGGA